METKYLTLTKENIETEHICCAFSDKKCKESYPPLKKFVSPNPYGTLSINFFNPQAVKALNKALLISYYGIRYWDIPKGYLCPPIPGRADYIHYIADLLNSASSLEL